MLVLLITVVSDVVERKIAVLDTPAIEQRHEVDRVDHALVDRPVKANPRVVAPQPMLTEGIGVGERIEPHAERDLLPAREQRVHSLTLDRPQALVGIDVQDPRAADGVEREIAGPREIVLPTGLDHPCATLARDLAGGVD